MALGDYVQEVWESQEGALPHPSVTAIRQTRDGYLWIGTYGGLVRFDGAEFQPPALDGVPALLDHTKCILEAQDGALWIGNRRQGALRIHNGVASVLGSKEGLADDVRAMAQTKDGTLWFATATGLVARDSSGRMHRYTRQEGLPESSVWALYADVNGDLWFGTNGFGLVRHRAGQFRVVPLPSVVAQAARGMDPALGPRVMSIARDRAGVLWAGTSVGLARIGRDDRESAFEHPGVQVNLIVPTRRGDLWLGTASGLIRRHGESARTYGTTDGLLQKSVLTAFEDAEGGVWFGTRVGLARLRPRVGRTYTARDGLDTDIVMCVMQTPDGTVWAGHRNGLSRLRDERWSTLGPKDGLPHVAVRALAAGPDGTLWIGTLDGLAMLRNGRLTTFPTGPRYAVRSLAVDAAGRLWIGTMTGLDVLEDGVLREVLTKETTPCPATTFTAIVPARDHNVWIGTGGGGLIRWRDGRAECSRDERVLARNDIRSLSEGGDGALWISSIGGLARVANGVREEFAGSSGPFNASVYAALEDGQGSLWCNTPKGLFQLSIRNIGQYADRQRAPFIYRTYGTGDGMETSVGSGDGQPTAWRSGDGRLWFTTVSGLTVVDPTRIESNDTMPLVYVEGLAANRQPVDVRGPRRLPAGTRDVELRFTALSLAASQGVMCRYRLEGFDASWVDSGSRRIAYYTNLPPRHYRFRVTAASPSGVWSETGATLDFEVLPHFYQRRSFLPLCALLLVGAATMAYRIRIARMRAIELELQRRVEQGVAQIKTLRGLLPICASCKKIRDDSGYWNQMETYISEHSSADFSHGICPDCMVALYPDYVASQRPGP